MKSKLSLPYFKNAQRVSIFNQMSPVHTLLLYFIKIHLILSSHLLLGIPTGLFPSGVPNQTPCEFIFDTHMLRARPYHHPRLGRTSNIMLRVQTTEFPIMQFSPSYFIPAVTLSQVPILANLQSTYFP